MRGGCRRILSSFVVFPQRDGLGARYHKPVRARRRLVSAASVLLGLCLASPILSTGPRAADTLPSRLSDTQFWTLIEQSSEPNGWFRSDNLLSNELRLQHVIPDLVRTARRGRIYMGVGPEQNFTYIAALKPSMAFIVDVRRGNLQLHLMYKALFELSADRAEFVSRLFSKKRPPGLTVASPARDLMAAYWNVDTDEGLYKQNVKAIQDQLTARHGFPIPPEDVQGIMNVYHAFYWFGPSIMYSSTGGFGGRYQPTYADLMAATDADGEARGFLSSEENFTTIKDLESKNLLLPIVGNFAGQKAIREVGRYLKEHGATVSAFYLSNVEQYLNQDGVWRSFCANVATLPLDETSTFIRAVRAGGSFPGMGLGPQLGRMQDEVRSCTPDRPQE
jgi:hypothetical protein